MWNYEKRLQYPVNIKQTNPKIAQVIMSQYGGPDGELGASMRYISQRYTMPYREVAGILNDIGYRGAGTFRDGFYDRASADKRFNHRRSLKHPGLTNIM